MDWSWLNLYYLCLSFGVLMDFILRPGLLKGSIEQVVLLEYEPVNHVQIASWPTLGDCQPCSGLPEYPDVTFPLTVTWSFEKPLPHSTLSIFASFDLESWFIPTDSAVITQAVGSHTFPEGCYGAPGGLYLVVCVYNGALNTPESPYLNQGREFIAGTPEQLGPFYLYCDHFENRCGATCSFQSTEFCNASGVISEEGYNVADFPSGSTSLYEFDWFYMFFVFLSLQDYISQGIYYIILLFFWKKTPEPPSMEKGPQAMKNWAVEYATSLAEQHKVAATAENDQTINLNVVTCTSCRKDADDNVIGVNMNRLVHLLLSVYVSLKDSLHESTTTVNYVVRFETQTFTDGMVGELENVMDTVNKVLSRYESNLSFLRHYLDKCMDDSDYKKENLLGETRTDTESSSSRESTKMVLTTENGFQVRNWQMCSSSQSFSINVSMMCQEPISSIAPSSGKSQSGNITPPSSTESSPMLQQNNDDVRYRKGKVHGLNQALRFWRKKKQIENTKHVRQLVAIIDDRHFPTRAFWNTGLPILSRFKYRFLQFPQQFYSVTPERDPMDVSNGTFFFYHNVLRNYLGSVSSSGTNTIWSVHAYESGEEFLFETQTLVEDTETSQHIIVLDEKSLYVADANIQFVKSIAKDAQQYATSLHRWSFGAVQMYALNIIEGHKRNYMFWRVGFFRLILHVILALLTLYWRSVDFLLIVIPVILLCIALFCHFGSKTLHHIMTYFLLWNDITYWATGILSPLVWIFLVPIHSVIHGDVLLQVNLQAYMFFILLSSLVQWAMVSFIKFQSHIKENHLNNARLTYFVSFNIFIYHFVVSIPTKLFKDRTILCKENDQSWDQDDFVFLAYLRVAMVLEMLLLLTAFIVCIFNLLLLPEVNVYSAYFLFALTIFINIQYMVHPLGVIVAGKDFTLGSRHVSLLITGFVFLLYSDTITNSQTLCYLLPSSMQPSCLS